MGAEVSWTREGAPGETGWYAVVVCWDREEGEIPMAGHWNGRAWDHPMISGWLPYRNETEQEASDAAYRQDVLDFTSRELHFINQEPIKEVDMAEPMKWYYEYKTFDGSWKPAASPEEPSFISPSGEKRNYRAVKKIPEEMLGKSLSFIRDHLSPDGKFYQIYGGKS